MSALRIIKPNVDGHVLVFNDGCSLQQSQLMFAGPRGPLMKLLLFSADVREAGRDVVIKTSVPYMVNKPIDHLVRLCLYLKGCKSFFLKKKICNMLHIKHINLLQKYYSIFPRYAKNIFQLNKRIYFLYHIRYLVLIQEI